MNDKTDYEKIKEWFHQHPRLNPKSFTFNRVYRTVTNSNRLLPNFIIIGFQKCGTTTLFDNLIKSPNIGMSSKKEVHFFDFSYWRGISWYRAQFPLKITKLNFEEKNKEPYLVVDASPLYIFHPQVPQRVKKVLPNAKLIVIMRNPVDMAYSHYQHYKRRNLEKMSFEEVIDDDERRFETIMKRFQNDEIRDYNVKKIAFPYISMAIYVKYIKNWLNVFPKNQFLFLQTEELNQNIEMEFRKIYDFIEIPSFNFKYVGKSNVGNYQPMKSSTRERLLKFYKPFNQELENILETKFQWEK